jgi:hypothetical protein
VKDFGKRYNIVYNNCQQITYKVAEAILVPKKGVNIHSNVQALLGRAVGIV